MRGIVLDSKTCTSCKVNKNVSEFSFRNKAKNILASNCKKCQKVWKDKHYVDNKQSYIETGKLTRNKKKVWWKKLKENLSCRVCGETHPATLDFHHLDPTKKEFTVSRSLTDFGKDKIIEEIKKCEVLCANCHRILHYNERNASIV